MSKESNSKSRKRGRSSAPDIEQQLQTIISRLSALEDTRDRNLGEAGASVEVHSRGLPVPPGRAMLAPAMSARSDTPPPPPVPSVRDETCTNALMVPPIVTSGTASVAASLPPSLPPSAADVIMSEVADKLATAINAINPAREELASFDPWGRAGGGARNARGVRFTNLRTKGIYPEDELRGVCQYEPCHRFPTPRHRYRRAPVRLHEDPQLCYAFNLRQSVDNDIRYKRTPVQQQNYKQILDDMVDTRKKTIKDEKKQSLDYERKMQTMEGPWGKPGPGGAAWRNPRDVGLNFSKSMGWTDNEIFTKLQGENKLYKRSSLALPKVKKDDDTREPIESEKENMKPSNVDKLPDIKKTNSANGKSPEQKEEYGINNKVVNDNGKGRRSPRKSKSKFVKRLSNGDRVQKIVPDDNWDVYDGDLQNGDARNGMEKKLTPEANILRVTGGIELVPLLARRRRVGARTLPSSDVTRTPDQQCQWREIDVQYLRDLKQQIRVKNQQIEDKRKDSAESVRRHHETWDSIWGRPGHGAPAQRGKYARSNLAQLLYVGPLANAQ